MADLARYDGSRPEPPYETTSDEVIRLNEKVEQLRAALERLRLTATLLLQNAEGCATNHYGHDCELNGLPGWLADAKRDILAAAEI